MPSKNSIRLAFAFAVATAVAPSASALQIVLVPDAGLSANTAALASFRAAADLWQNAFTDNITVTINAGLSSGFSDPNIIGSTNPTSYTYGTYDQARALLVNDAADEPSNAIVSSLPTATQLRFTRYSNVAVNNTMAFTQANLKALGVTGFGTTADATITFNSNFSFDYNRADGQTANTEDFETVAEHEIGHALGFISGVDTQSVTNGFYISPLDMFRFETANVPTTASQFTDNSRYFIQGGTAFFSDTQNRYGLSTVADGNQASHWKADELSGTFVGLMDPTLAYGQAYDYTAADLRAFDLIGWDLRVQATPEPATFAALGLGVLAVLRRRKRA